MSDAPPRDPATTIPPRRRPRLGVRTLLALVACCASLFVAARAVWENRPENAPARALRMLRSGNPDDRLLAARELPNSGPDQVEEAAFALIAALGDESAAVRSAAVRSLADLLVGVSQTAAPRPLPSDRATAAVIAALGDEATEVREAAVGALGMLVDGAADDPAGAARSREALSRRLAALKARNPGAPVGEIAAVIGPRVGENRPLIAIGALLSALEDPAPDVRTLVLGMTAGLYAPGAGRKAAATVPADARAMVSVLAVPLGDASPRVRAAALFALGAAGQNLTADPPPALLAALDDPKAEVRVAAVSALAQFRRGGGDPVVLHVLRTIDREADAARKPYIEALHVARPTASAVPALIEALRSRDRAIRAGAAKALGEVGPPAAAAVAALIALTAEPEEVDSATVSLTYEQLDTGLQAARALGAIAPETPRAAEAVGALAGLMRLPSRYRRFAAVVSLARFGPAAAPALPALIAVMREAASAPDDSVVAWSVAKALGELAPDTPAAADAIAVLTSALESDSEGTRCEAIKSLVRFGPAASGAIPELLAVSRRDSRPNVRFEAATALEALGARR